MWCNSVIATKNFVILKTEWNSKVMICSESWFYPLSETLLPKTHEIALFSSYEGKMSDKKTIGNRVYLCDPYHGESPIEQI